MSVKGAYVFITYHKAYDKNTIAKFLNTKIAKF